jgi:hypothetical protein
MRDKQVVIKGFIFLRQCVVHPVVHPVDAEDVFFSVEG